MKTITMNYDEYLKLKKKSENKIEIHLDEVHRHVFDDEIRNFMFPSGLTNYRIKYCNDIKDKEIQEIINMIKAKSQKLNKNINKNIECIKKIKELSKKNKKLKQENAKLKNKNLLQRILNK